MSVVRVIVGIPLLLLLVGCPGWLLFRLLLVSLPPRSPSLEKKGEKRRLHHSPSLRGRELGGRNPARTITDLIPLECAALALALGVFVVGPVALVLAMFGVYSLWLLALIIALGSVALLVIARRRALPVVAWQWDRGAWLCLGLLAVGAALFLRPGETLIGGEDTGVYYNGGVAMAKQGSILLHDPVLADIDGDKATVRHLLGNLDNRRYLFYGDLRFTGFNTDSTSGEIVPQNLHLWPAWLAIFYGFFGTLGPAYAPALFGLFGLLGLVLLARRLFGWPVALIAGLFLALNGIEVWFVRQTYTEAYQQFALMAALFGLLLLEERRDAAVMRLGAVFAALALGNAALTHEETLFLLLLVVAYAVALLLLRAWRRAHTWFFTLLGGMIAIAVVQAGVFALGYTEGLWHHVYQNIWHQRVPLAAAGVVGIIALVVIDRLRAFWLPVVRDPRTGRWARSALAVGTALYAIYGYILRPHILIGHAGTLSSYIGAPTPPGHDANLVRLGWYWSPLGILLIALGATLLIGRNLNRLTGGLLAFALVHTVVFVNETYTTDGYIYALRHYVPIVMPIFALFAAYAVWNLPNPPPPFPRGRGSEPREDRGVQNKPRHQEESPLPRGKGPGVRFPLSLSRTLGLATAALLVLFFVATRAGTWTVRRYSGVEAQMGQIAAQFPANSLLLFSGDRDQPHLLATPFQFIYGRTSFVISTNNPRGDLLEAWLNRESATHPVYILMGNDGGKLFFPHTRLVPETRFGPTFTVTLHDFESLQLQKPHNPQDNILRYTVYRYEPAHADPPLGAAPLTITMGQADEQYDVAGFYGIEHDRNDPTPYRWTGPTALLRVPWTASLAQTGGTITLRLAGGMRPAALGIPAHAWIALDPGLSDYGPTLADFDLTQGFADYTVTIPPGALPVSDNGAALLRITSCVDPAKKGKDLKQCNVWSPQDYAPPDAPIYDSRVLGVQVQSVTLTPR
ncbi:MAG: hypothetical protein M3Y58_02685 [Chloroflexota bacterium]|nr:hypothetical protein [Chloroflexota bacterium]